MPEPFCELESETDSEKEFVGTVKDADAAALRSFLKGHPEVCAKIDAPWFDFDAPAMVWAASQLDREKVKALLEHGADIDAASRWAAGSYTALQHCFDGATKEKLSFASFLIDCGATIDFHSAAGLGRIELLREHLAADPNKATERGPDGATALHFSASVEAADLLLAHGADIAARCVDHRSTAGMWLLKSYPEVSRYLAENGGPVDIFMAAALGDNGLIDRCLAAHPDAISARVCVGDWTEFTGGGDKYTWVLGPHRSPHSVARESGHESAYRHLLDQSSPAIRLRVACQCADRLAAEVALAEIPDAIRDLPPEEKRALADAAWEGDHASVSLMLDLGFDPHVRGDHQSTPLDRASFHGHADVVASLLKADSDPPLSAQNEFGGTPLNTCLYGRIHGWKKDTDYPATIRALLDAGAHFHPDWLPYPDAEIGEILKAHMDSAIPPGGGV